MDNVEKLLCEAKHLYQRRKRNKRIFTTSLLSCCCVLWISVVNVPTSVTLGDDDFDSYYTALYEPLNSEFFNLDISTDAYYLGVVDERAI